MALDTSPDKPAPVRVVSQLIGQWVHRLGAVWVEGQITQLNRRPGTQTAFLSLRDPSAEVSVQVTCPARLLDALDMPLTDGARVVVHARPSWYHTRGTLSLAADDVRPVGVGELLARLERLRKILGAEGLFATERKRPLPFLPTTIGLICGRDSKAEHDVVENARRRWPGVHFSIQPVAVQGPSAASQIIEALRALDRDTSVDVIVVARGGGSVEDLLPFSDEALLRSVAAATTPVVSAIGHEGDSPLLDLVADARASTPTDAAKLVVPDVIHELNQVTEARRRMRSWLHRWIEREQAGLDAMRSRPALADATHSIQIRTDELDGLRERARRTIRYRLDRADDELRHTRARVRALSPAATLERGYALVQRGDAQGGGLVTDPAELEADELLNVRVASGAFDARFVGSHGPDGGG